MRLRRTVRVRARSEEFTPDGWAAVTPAPPTISGMSDVAEANGTGTAGDRTVTTEVAEIVLRHRVPSRIAAGFPGWAIERRAADTVLRRKGATAADLHRALAEIGDLGLELESFRRLAPA
jgi:hypothetical protein